MKKWMVTASPHVRSGETVTGIMLDVIIALLPALIAAVRIFGFRALLVVAVSVGSCVLTEYVSRKIMKRENTIGDLSAVVTGILLAYNLPVDIPLWMVVFGAVAAIAVVKQMFGGLGQNFVNPAITGRIVLLVSFPTAMTTFAKPLSWSQGADAVTTATPLASLSGIDLGGDIAAQMAGMNLPTMSQMFFGLNRNRACLDQSGLCQELVNTVRRLCTLGHPIFDFIDFQHNALFTVAWQHWVIFTNGCQNIARITRIA